MEKNKQQLMKNLTKFQDQKVGLMLVACFLASMLFLVLSKANNDISLRILTPKSSLVAVSAGLKADDKTDSVDGGSGTSPLCDVAQPRSEFCEMDGDVRIHGNSSTVTFVSTTSAAAAAGRSDESYRIRPYARKGDDTAMSFIREVHVRRDSADEPPPRCTVNHTDTPAIVFSTSAYAGNIFHDYSDILIPLFLTSRQYDGEVRFLVANINTWWLKKYRSVLGRLTKYPVIDFDRDAEVRCFSRVVVGLKCSKELSIDPSASPSGYAMPDFTRFLRASYNLTRDAVGPRGPKERPRMMIISRSRARAFRNVDEIVRLARETGFEAVVAEAGVGSDVARFAGLVNSCDAMMGVHGAGLTNLLYLPANATVVQVVPWGGLGWVARYDYGVPAADSGLHYLQYEIREEESSLAEVYARDHAVFKNPFKYHKLGWMAIREMFMDNQTVKLDIDRFRPVLLEALQLVRKQQSVSESVQ
ncbi:glycosyltransferase [Iris pallida]|uniref:Glycosyltransferase n=1 Tax=Iris pallida TaxID=29817 RepID=A0AAX6HWQ2_IRIPA|nr:glycosyltransferase [Iris pallida]